MIAVSPVVYSDACFTVKTGQQAGEPTVTIQDHSKGRLQSYSGALAEYVLDDLEQIKRDHVEPAPAVATLLRRYL